MGWSTLQYRTMNSSSDLLKTADLEINTSQQQVYKNKQLVKLSHLSFRTVMVLVKASPQPVTVDQLIEAVWQSVAVSPETVTQRIALIRKALTGDDDTNEKYIASVRSLGYRWVPPVKASTAIKSKNWIKVLLLMPVILVFSWYLINAFTPINDADIRQENSAIKVNSVPNENDYTQQAWRYLNKHEANSNQLAIGLFRKSLAVDPNQLNALTGLSIALSHEVTKFNQPHTLLAEAKQAAELALKINPEYAQAWAALAFVYDAEGEIDAAIVRYERALELAPENTSTASSLAYLYGLKGQLVKAMKLNIQVLGSKQQYLDVQIASILDLMGFDAVAEQWYQKADELSPDNVFATHLRARYYVSRNQFQMASKVIESAIERGIQRPELPVIKGIIAWIQGDLLGANAAFEQAVLIDETDIEAQFWLFMQTHAMGTTLEKRNQFTAQWFSGPSSWPDHWVLKAQFYAHFADYQQALLSLKLAYEQGYRNHRWLQQLPQFQMLHTDPVWLNLLEAMQNDVSKQRAALLQVDWLPTSFLDPQN